MGLIIIGAGGQGKVAADIAALCGYREIAFLDDDESVKICMAYPVLGKTETAVRYPTCDFFVAIGNPITREHVQNMLRENKLHITTLIHPSAVIAEGVTIGAGSVVMAGAVINPGSVIGEGCIINTGTIVDHDNVLEDYVHVSVGSQLAGAVHVGKYTWIGIGATVSNNLNICSSCMIGAGAVVVKDIEKSGIYVGVPARKADMEKKKFNKFSGGGIPPAKRVEYRALHICAA